MKIIDISMEIKEGILTYPKNPSPKISPYTKMPRNRTNESLIKMGSHTGTHIDAPLHVYKNGKSAEKIDLKTCYGPCRVLDLSKVGKEIHRHHLEKYKIKKGEIILLKTENSTKQRKKFRKDFAHVKKCAADYLIKKGIKTLGFDYLSVKEYHNDHHVHVQLIKNLTLFEGLDLKNVKGGKYTFAGLPLKIKTDGAPARAILIQN